MSKKGGLTSSVLGNHLGFDVPAVVRRKDGAALHSVEATREAPSKADAAPAEVAREAASVPSKPALDSEAAREGRAARRAGGEDAVRAPVEEKALSHPANEETSTAQPTAEPAEPAESAPSEVGGSVSDDEAEGFGAGEGSAVYQRPATSARRRSAAPLPSKPDTRSSIYRVGTQRAPYQRADGTKTEKVGFTAPHGLKEEINLFCLTHKLGPASEWMVATLRKEMERQRRSRS